MAIFDNTPGDDCHSRFIVVSIAVGLIPIASLLIVVAIVLVIIGLVVIVLVVGIRPLMMAVAIVVMALALASWRRTRHFRTESIRIRICMKRKTLVGACLGVARMEQMLRHGKDPFLLRVHKHSATSSTTQRVNNEPAKYFPSKMIEHLQQRCE